MNTLTSIALACGLAALALSNSAREKGENPMQLGSFTLGLAVKDIKASKAFYEKLDFKQVSGDIEKHWVVLQNGTMKIGLFQGMFDTNIMTFNPGMTPTREPLKDFQDVRELQRVVKERGIRLQSEVDESSDGPGSFTFADPDGNPIFVDQYVPKPKR